MLRWVYFILFRDIISENESFWVCSLLLRTIWLNFIFKSIIMWGILALVACLVLVSMWMSSWNTLHFIETFKDVLSNPRVNKEYQYCPCTRDGYWYRHITICLNLCHTIFSVTGHLRLWNVRRCQTCTTSIMNINIDLGI